MLYPETTLLYLSLLVLSSILAYAYSHTDKFLGNILMFLLFFVISIPAVLRTGIGKDFYMYQEMYNIVADGGEAKKEFGYAALMRLSTNFNFNFQAFQGIISGLTYFFVLLVFKDLPKRYAFLYVVFFMLMYYLNTYCTIRQGLGLSIVNYALLLGQKGKVKWAYLFFLIAFSFHFSAAIIFVFFLFRRFRINYLILISIGIAIGVLSRVFGVASLIIENFPEWIPYSEYIGTNHTRSSELSSGLGVLFTGVLASIPLFTANSIVKKRPELNILFLCVFGFVMGTLFSAEIYIFNRVKETFTLTMVLAFVFYFENLKLRWFREVFLIINLLFFSMIFYINATVNFVDKKGGLGIIPYTTIYQNK